MRVLLSVIAALILFGIVGALTFLGYVDFTNIWTTLAVPLLMMALGILYWGFKPIVYSFIKGQSEVIIQKGSLRFCKYPLFLVNSQGTINRMPNMAYSVITAENQGKIKAKECEVEITLKNEKSYRSKVLSSGSTKTPNPMTVSVDPEGGTVGFHSLCLKLNTFEAFLPNYSLGKPGKFTGAQVKHGKYEILGKAIYDGKQSKMTPLGKIKVPEDFLEKATIPNDVQVIIDQGGYAVYLEHHQGKVRAKFYGHNDDDDTKEIILKYLAKMPKIDYVFEDNGKLRRWKRVDILPQAFITITDVDES